MNKRLHVGNLDYSVTSKDLEELFSGEGMVVSVRVIRRLDGKSKGFGYVEMETEDEALKAIERFNKTEFKNRTIYVNEAKPLSERAERGVGEGRSFRYRSKDDLNSKLRRLRKRF